MNASKIRSTLLLLLTAFIWGIAFVAQSVGMDYIGPFTFNAVRFLIGALVLLPCIPLLDAAARRRGAHGGRPKGAKERRTLWLGGVLCGAALCLAACAQQIGIQYTTVGKAGFITALYIVIVPVLGIFLGKRAGLKIWLSVAAAAAGLYLLCVTDGFSVAPGDLMVLACALLFSFHILLIDHFSPLVDGVRLSCIQFFTSGVLSACLMFAFEAPTFAAILAAWQPILYAGVLSCGVAYTLQVVAQRDADPVVASLVLSLESVFSVLAGWVILGQGLAGRELFGCALVFSAIILAQLPSRRRIKTPAAAERSLHPAERR